MTPAEDLTESLESFAESCNENARLMGMIKDWNRVLHIHATDIDHHQTLITDLGTVQVHPGAPDSADLIVQSTAETLAAIFYGELSPNEPYNDGSLRIQGAEADVVRLDFVIAMLWD
jgi:putative sterol carrier protein